MIEIFSSITGFTRSVVDSEKNVPRTNSPDGASPRVRAFYIRNILEMI